MSPKTWIIIFLATLGAGLGLVLALDVYLDVYGLFRDEQAGSRPALGDQRIAKYLLASRYVPSNFDGLLLGPSITANWKPSRIAGGRFYNASLNGANIVEEKAVADEALHSGKIREAVLLIHPSLTLSHDFKTSDLVPAQKISALGSESLLDAYKDKLYRIEHPRQLITDGFGTEYWADAPHALNLINVQLMRPGIEFEVDSVALAAYEELLQALQKRHVQTLLVVPPLSEELLARKKEAFGKYTELILHDAPTHPAVLDFTAPSYTSFRRNALNFTDGVHLTRKGADAVTDEISRYLTTVSLTRSPADHAAPTQ